MDGKPNGPISLAASQALQSLYDTYEMNKHTQDDSGQAAGLQATPNEHFDVLIVGAGISGIAGAYHLRQECPDSSFVLL